MTQEQIEQERKEFEEWSRNGEHGHLFVEQEVIAWIGWMERAKAQERKERQSTPPVCFTHFAEHCDPPWLAIHRETVLKMLKDYELTHEQKTDVFHLMAGYCRLIDEAGLIHYGRTENEAIAKACGLIADRTPGS